MAGWEDEYKDTTAPSASAATAAAPGTSWEDEYRAPSSPEKPNRFIPAVGGETNQEYTDWGGLVSGDPERRKEAWKGLAGQSFGGAFTRGVPGIRQLAPTTPADLRLMENHSILEKLGNVGGAAISSLPTQGIMPGGPGLWGTAANAITQGGISGVQGIADKLIEKGKDVTAKDLALAGGVDAAGGAAGPIAGRVISPFQHPSAPSIIGNPLADYKYGSKSLDEMMRENIWRNMPGDDPAKGAQSLVDLVTEQEGRKTADALAARKIYEAQRDRIMKWQGKFEGLTSKFETDPFLKYGVPIAGAVLGHEHGGLSGAVMDAAIAHLAPKALSGYIGNQMMTSTKQAILNALISGATKQADPNDISDLMSR